MLRTFWEEELRIVQRAMGFRFPANLVFDRMVLSDEAAEKALLIQLADRDIISWELVVERFGETPEIEEVRLRREARKRKTGKMPRKVSPYHSDKEHDYKKALLNQGLITPSELGVQLEERNPGEKTLLEYNKENEESKKKQGVVGEGRPQGSKDTKKRKKKRVLPRGKAAFIETYAWAENAQAKIGQLCSPMFLASLKKKNMRELTNTEAKHFETFKFHLLCQFKPNDDISEEAVKAIISNSSLSIPSQVNELLKQTVAKYMETNSKEPPFEVLRRFYAGAFAFWKGEYDSEKASNSNDSLPKVSRA
jgi:hypothetical protein